MRICRTRSREVGTVSKKTIGIVLLVVGVVVLLVSLFAQQLGVGGVGFGPKQIAGVAVGAAAAIVGVVLAVLR